ncbi:MAG: hypothetical protein LJE87_14150 [Deltaproteobacteria bacterium]|jgi:hypothetical protein|nr:hypothetical protein [Deltaproteobacteria bacterium]
MIVLPGVLGCRTLRRTVQVRLGSDTLWLPGGTLIIAVSRHQLVKHPSWVVHCARQYRLNLGEIGVFLLHGQY